MQPTNPWTTLGKRARELANDVYAEAVASIATAALSQQDTARETVHDTPNTPNTHAEHLPHPPAIASQATVALLSTIVAAVAAVETATARASLPCVAIREADADELRRNVGALGGVYLPSAYDPWEGARSRGRLRLRYGYNATQLAAAAAASPSQLLLPAEALRPVALDEPTLEWVRARLEQPAATTRLAVWRALKRRLYHYDAAVVAFRGFGRHYLLSRDHWEELLAPPGYRGGGGGGRALDVGAGDGSLTEPWLHLFDDVHATEMTHPLAARLRGALPRVTVHVAATLSPSALGGAREFDAVFILNVLDRCKDPVGMLRSAHALLAPRGTLVVSVVLPPLQSDAAARVGASQRHWRVQGATFETAAASLVETLLVPAGFALKRLVRAPYLCAGDSRSPVAALDAAVAVLEKVDEAAAAAAEPRARRRRRAASPRLQRSQRDPTMSRESSESCASESESESVELAACAHDHVSLSTCSECDSLGGYVFAN